MPIRGSPNGARPPSHSLVAITRSVYAETAYLCLAVR
jgi:hypothetical protein